MAEQSRQTEAAKVAYHHGQLREALLDAGDRLLHAEGLRGFTLRACARMVGVSHAAPKHHFGDVQGFLTAVGARGFARLTDRLRAEIRKADSLEAEFVATSRAYVQFAVNNPEHFRIMFRGDLLNRDDPEFYRQVGITLTELTNVILRQRGEPETHLEAMQQHVDSTEVLVADIIVGWSHIHGLAHLRTEGQLGMIPDRRYESMVDEAARRLSRLLQAEAVS